MNRLASSAPTLAALVLTTFAACSTPAALAAPAGAPAPRRTLAVSGTATLDLVPDCLDVTMTLSAEAPRPKGAMAQLRAKEDVLVKGLVGAGVAPGEVKLSGSTVTPLYDRYNNVTGYSASITVVASTKKLDLVGDMMEAASIAGTQSMATAYRVSDLVSYKKKVRKLALEAAAEKARDTTAALDTHLGRVTDISESAGEYNPGAFGNAYVASGSRSDAPQLGPQSQPLTMTMNVVYELE